MAVLSERWRFRQARYALRGDPDHRGVARVVRALGHAVRRDLCLDRARAPAVLDALRVVVPRLPAEDRELLRGRRLSVDRGVRVAGMALDEHVAASAAV